MSYRIPIGYPCVGQNETVAVMGALGLLQLSQGVHVRSFEETYAKRLHLDHAVATNSGSSANLIALSAMKEKFGWKQGDRVIVPALTFATAVAPVLQLGLKPLWCDVDIDGNMSFADGLLHAIKIPNFGDIKALVLVHSLGVPARDTQLIIEFCESYGIKVLEDTCESHGAKLKFPHPMHSTTEWEVGTFGTISTLSFYVAHNMTTGEGGMAFTNDLELNCFMRSYREFGRPAYATHKGWGDQGGALGYYHTAYTFTRLGYNVRMTDLEACIGLEQLKKLDGFNERRRQIVTRIREGLKGYSYGLPDEKGRVNSYYSLKLDTPPGILAGQVANYLENNGIETRPFMGGNLLRQQAFKCETPPWRFPMAEKLHTNALCVGCHPGMSDECVDFLIGKLKDFAEGK